MFCTPSRMSGRSPTALCAAAKASAEGKRITLRSSRRVYRARNDARKAEAAVGPRFIFQLAARMGRWSAAISAVRQGGEPWQRLAFEELERCAATGRDVAHLVCQSG